MFHMSVEPVSYFKNIYTKPSVKKACMVINYTHETNGFHT